MGCSAGRHLAHLHDAGFSRLSGVEVNPEAFAVMRETYPALALAEAGSFHRGTAEDLVGGFAADAFDATFSVETPVRPPRLGPAVRRGGPRHRRYRRQRPLCR